MKRLMLVMFLAGLMGIVGYLYWAHTIRAEERRAFVPFKQMAEARAIAIRKHREAVISVAWRRTFNQLNEERALQHNLGSPVLAYCENMLTNGNSNQLPDDVTDKIDKIYLDLYGPPDEGTLIAAKACAEAAMRDAETVVSLSDSFEKRP